MKYSNIREESLKIKVGSDFFPGFDTSEIIGNIDFCVKSKQENLFDSTAPLLWAEAKTGDYDTITMFVQLILTIGKAKTFDKTLPPAFLGAFDFKKIAFVEYMEIQDIFYENDFNWNVTPSNHDTKEFKLVYERVEKLLKKKTRTFDYVKDEERLRDFIKNTLGNSGSLAKVRINKNNFLPIYLRWVEIIKPLIDVNRDELKKNNILDSDFFLADLFVDDRNTNRIDDDETIKDDLFVTFENGGYKISRNDLGTMFDAIIKIKNIKQYEFFWKNYKRPPARQYQEYIISRRDLIVPQDIRERKGAFFTPRIWVEKSQEYMANYFGENYQDEYYIRDCAAGTGNLLAGLTNKYNIFASTLDKADVNVMHNMIKDKTINLLENHVFQFDFLNDDFSKLPESLQEIINDEKKRKKLIVYINPPYAEATSSYSISNENSKHKAGVSCGKIKERYQKELAQGAKELFILFLYRCYVEISGCFIANFSTIKALQGLHYKEFRELFLPKLEKLFIVPGNTFDNVKGKFPIGFFIWNSQIKEYFKNITIDIFDYDGKFIGNKNIEVSPDKNIKDWLRKYKDTSNPIGYLVRGSADVQNNNIVFITTKPSDSVLKASNANLITKNNLLVNLIFHTVRKVIEDNRINDRDQFLRPKDERENDIEFQNDCLIFSLFAESNTIKSETGVNHWIPFTESQVNSREGFKSHFMSDFLKGREFSPEAQNVYESGRILWTYYHENCQNDYMPNASLYEIREYFQGRNDKGKMNNKSSDGKYIELIGNLRASLKILGDKITEKVYEYEFLKR